MNLINIYKSFLFKPKTTRINNLSWFDKTINTLKKRYSKNEKDIRYEDLRDYEKNINDRIRLDDDYKILHDKILMVSPLGLIPTLYYYEQDKMIIVGEVSFIPDNQYIGIKSQFKK